MDVSAARDDFRRKARRVLQLVAEERAALDAADGRPAGSRPPARLPLMGGLNDLVMVKEDRILLPVLLERGGEPAAIARRLKERNLDLQQEYDLFVQRWLLPGNGAHDAGYRAAAVAMMDWIEDQVGQDRVVVEDLLDRVAG